MRSRRLLVAWVAAVGLAALVAGCGDDGDDDATDGTPTSQSSTTTVPDASGTSTTAAGGELPGEEFDLGPTAGDTLAVVGVRHDDVLNVRARPGADEAVVAELSPTAADLVATGAARILPSSIWYEVDADGATGWVNARYVGYLGDTSDTTAEVVAASGGSVPVAATMDGLGAAVAATVVAGLGEGDTSTVMVVAPTAGDLGEVTYDVVGFPDDAVLGRRLHVFGQPGGGSYALKSVESTVLCRRGVTAGVCA